VIHVSDEVRDALAGHAPVVALESAVLTHGLPAPLNLEVALQMAAAVRAGGAVPAMTAVVSGRVSVGLTEVEVEALAAGGARKCALRDLPVLAGSSASGGTTVAASLAIAHLAGIGVLATGGIGGVHRDAPDDISSDITALSRFPLTVVCSGPKTLLDLARTREVLETGGVPVLGWRTERMPAFYAVDSGLLVDERIEEAWRAARIAAERDALGLRAAILVCAPPLTAEHLAAEQLSPVDVERMAAQAVVDARSAGALGAAATPFVLRRMAELSGGATLEINRRLLLYNAELAGRIAVEQAAIAAGR